MPAKRTLEPELRARMCMMRKSGKTLNAIASECHVCVRLVTECVAWVKCDRPAPGRSTPISEDELEQIRREAARGLSMRNIGDMHHVGVDRLKKLLSGAVDPDSDVVDEEPKFMAEFWRESVPTLDEAAFASAGVPDSEENRRACAGHSSAWMRLYRLRVLNPGYAEYGDAPDAVAR